MATARGFCLVLAALLALLAVSGASTLTIFDGPGCTGSTVTISCGKCYNINSTKFANGGYYYLHIRGTARFYNNAGCSDWPFPAENLIDDTWYCDGIKYKSVLLTCSSTLGSISDQQQQQQQEQQRQ